MGQGDPGRELGEERVPSHAAPHLGATQGSPESQLVCLGESGERATTDPTEGVPGWRRWAGGGGGGGGATYIFRVGGPRAVARTPAGCRPRLRSPSGFPGLSTGVRPLTGHWPRSCARGSQSRCWWRREAAGGPTGVDLTAAGLRPPPRGWRPARRRRAAAGEEARQVSAPPGGERRGGGRAGGSASPLPVACCRLVSLRRWRGRLDVAGPVSAGRTLAAGRGRGRRGLRGGLGCAPLGGGRRLRGRRRGLRGWRRWRRLPG